MALGPAGFADGATTSEAAGTAQIATPAPGGGEAVDGSAVPAPHRSRIVTIGTGSPAGVYFAAGRAICNAINRDAARRERQGEPLVTTCRFGPSGGSAFNLRQVQRGAFTFAIAQANDQRAAMAPGTPRRVAHIPSLRTVLSLHAEPLQVVVAAGSGVRSFTDLAERRLAAGNRGSGTRLMVEQVLRAAALEADDLEAVESLTLEVQSEALCSGRIDAFALVSAVPTAAVKDALRGCGARLLPVTGALASALAQAGSGVVAMEIPAAAYGVGDEAVATVGVRAGLVTLEAVSTDVVRDVAVAVLADIDRLRAAHPALANLGMREMSQVADGAPLHTGAAALYAERRRK